jgi:serine/threonine protein kinase
MEYIKKWRIVELLDEGGQGKVYRVAEIKPGLDDAFVQTLGDLTATIMTTKQRKEHLDEFRKNLVEVLRLEAPENQGALKVLHDLKHSENVEKAKARIKKEIDAMSKIKHPNLIKIVDVDPDYEWYVSKFYEKGTLEKGGDLFKGNFVKCLRAIRPLVEGVARLHEAGYVHRDIKPKNIFVGLNNELVLGDFGLIHFEDAGHKRVSETYENVGSRDWMPGWAMGMRLEEINPTFDVFGLGKVLWSMISGKTVLPLWYFSKRNFNVEQLFPGSTEMKFANALFEKCIVEHEKDCLEDAGALLLEMDHVLGDIGAGVDRMEPSKRRGDVEEAQRRILWLVGDEGDRGFTAEWLASRRGMLRVKMEYYLDNMVDGGLLERIQTHAGEDMKYFLSERGRRYVVESGLI